jgi:hypothetical protein
MFKKLSFIFSLGLFFCLGVYVSVFKTKNIVDYINTADYFTKVPSRDPAAIQKSFDFSGLDGSALEKAAKQRLLSGLNIVKKPDELGLELGHFVIKDEEGRKIFACQKFDRVTMYFEGEGSAVNGELPKMQVEGICEISEDINKISALWIPIHKIIREPVAEGEFNFKDTKSIVIQFMNVSESWPRVWRLTSVKLEDSKNESHFLKLENQDFQEFRAGPLVVTW